MTIQRRKFIQSGVLLGVGLATAPLQFCATPKKEDALAEPAKSKLSRFGIQLYSVKEDMAINPVATIRSLAGFGYTQLEGFDGGKGILWGMKPAEFKSLMTELQVEMVASHCNVFENLDAQAQQAVEAGIKYLV